MWLDFFASKLARVLNLPDLEEFRGNITTTTGGLGGDICLSVLWCGMIEIANCKLQTGMWAA
jgi:hypothetical protein